MPDRDHAYVQLAVDLVILTVREGRLQVLIIERAHDPYAGQAALPGGFLRAGENLHEAAVRELGEETGLDGRVLHLEQLAAYGAPDRDPRGRVVSIAYLAVAPDLPVPVAGSDARGARWVAADDVRGTLAFDHDEILRQAVERARTRLEATPLAAAFCGGEFTIGDLRHVYEAVWGMPLDPRNFSRKVLHATGFIRPTGTMRAPETGRPAALYELGPARALHPPILRSTAGGDDAAPADSGAGAAPARP